MLEVGDSFLMAIDFQGSVARAMHDSERLVDNAVRLVKGALTFGIPIVLVEQNPKGLGPTLPEIASLLPDTRPIPKLSFDCCAEASVVDRLRTVGRKQAIVAGIEAHVCVYQSAMGLLRMGFDVHVAADAIASRNPSNKAIALDKLRAAGAHVTSVEISLFELLKVADGPKFREILRIVK